METTEPSGLRGFKFSPLRVHCPIKRIKVKKTHYKAMLFAAGGGFYILHVYFPHLDIMGINAEVHWAFIVNALCALDPTA